MFFFFLTHCSRLIQSQKEREQQNKVPPSNTINSLSISKKEKKKKKRNALRQSKKCQTLAGYLVLCVLFLYI